MACDECRVERVRIARHYRHSYWFYEIFTDDDGNVIEVLGDRVFVNGQEQET